MQVGGEVARSGEYALAVLAFALSEELLPPFADEVEFGLVVYHYLNLLAGLIIQSVAYSGIYGGGILFERHVLAASLLHVGGSGHEFCDVEACAGNG